LAAEYFHNAAFCLQNNFLGYDFSSITSHYVMFLLDLFLLLQVFLVWKPLALISIYIELLLSSLLHVLVYIVFSATSEVYEIAVEFACPSQSNARYNNTTAAAAAGSVISSATTTASAVYAEVTAAAAAAAAASAATAAAAEAVASCLHAAAAVESAASAAVESSWRAVREAKIAETLSCIASLSLLLRFLSFKPSHVPLRKHELLLRASLCYRIFRHLL
jgi:hypothetical protein